MCIPHQKSDPTACSTGTDQGIVAEFSADGTGTGARPQITSSYAIVPQFARLDRL
jgi:hypothetical protein